MNNLQSKGTTHQQISEENPRFELKKWNPVAFWSWNIQVETCAICKNHIMENCIDCEANDIVVTIKDCVVSWGACNHAYHKHCIERWLKNKQTCPLDNKQWEFSQQNPTI